MRKEAAAAILELLDAARNDVGTGATITIVSAYRPVSYDRKLWLDYFQKYYWETLARRRQFYGGPRGLAAIVYMAHHVASSSGFVRTSPNPGTGSIARESRRHDDGPAGGSELPP